MIRLELSRDFGERWAKVAAVTEEEDVLVDGIEAAHGLCDGFQFENVGGHLRIVRRREVVRELHESLPLPAAPPVGRGPLTQQVDPCGKRGVPGIEMISDFERNVAEAIGG